MFTKQNKIKKGKESKMVCLDSWRDEFEDVARENR